MNTIKSLYARAGCSEQACLAAALIWDSIETGLIPEHDATPVLAAGLAYLAERHHGVIEFAESPTDEELAHAAELLSAALILRNLLP